MYQIVSLAKIMIIGNIINRNNYNKNTNNNNNSDPKIIPADICRKIRKGFLDDHFRTVNFNASISLKIKRILKKYFVHDIYDETDEVMNISNTNAKIELLQLSKEVAIGEKATTEESISLSPSAFNNHLKNISEMNSFSNYIHLIIRSLFNSYNSISH